MNDLNYVNNDGRMTFYFKGKLTFGNINENSIIKTAKNAKSIIFDLKDVSYISSVFIRVCLAVSKLVGVKQFSIINVNGLALKVFHIVGLDKLFELYPQQVTGENA